MIQKINHKLPLVSVIIPTFNRAQMLSMSVGTVLNQSYSDIEVIIVDDASSDNTEETVKGMGDERIRYIRHETNRGGAAARNTGISAARGEYIAFQDSDDEWLPGKLERQMDVFRSAVTDVGAVYTGFHRKEDGRLVYIPSHRIKKKDGNILKELLKENFVATPTLVVKKACIDKAGMFDDALPRFQDWEFAIRLAKQFSFRCIDEPLLTAHRFDDSISTNREALIMALEIILRKHHGTLKGEGRMMLANWYFSVGTAMCQAENVKSGRSYISQAIKIFPFNPRFWLSFFIVGILGQSVYIKIVRLYLFIQKTLHRFGHKAGAN